jgi:hypothetical protein
MTLWDVGTGTSRRLPHKHTEDAGLSVSLTGAKLIKTDDNRTTVLDAYTEDQEPLGWWDVRTGDVSAAWTSVSGPSVPSNAEYVPPPLTRCTESGKHPPDGQSIVGRVGGDAAGDVKPSHLTSPPAPLRSSLTPWPALPRPVLRPEACWVQKNYRHQGRRCPR